MLEQLGTMETWIALVSLIAMEMVLGIDNIVFISILTSRLPAQQRNEVARLGLGLALGMRVALLFALRWIMGLTEPAFHALGRPVSGRDLILLAGGLFLMAKATTEIYRRVEGPNDEETGARSAGARAGWVLAQIVALDLVFSLDSVITAVGMVPPDQIWIMVIAIIVSVLGMLAFAKPLGEVVLRHPSLKILALSFLVVIGVLLVAESLGRSVPKGYVYFGIGFSLVVELINIRFRGRAKASVSPQGEPAE